MSPLDEGHSLQSKVDTILQEAVRDDQFLGVSFVAVDRSGHKLYSGAHGRQGFESSEPMTVDMPGWLASMTKLMTAVSVMQVVERGLVGLDDDLGYLLPELKDPIVLTGFDSGTQHMDTKPASRPITLRHLLSHSSGYAYDDWDETLKAWALSTGKTQDLAGRSIQAFVRPLIFSPGDGWAYGPGLDWAGRVVEVLSGQSLGEFMQEHIWSPLGMMNTTFHPETRGKYPVLQLGLRNEGPEKPLKPGKGRWTSKRSWDMGGGGLYSSAADYAQFLTALLTDDGPLLSMASIDELFRPQLSGAALRDLNKFRTLGAVQIDIPLDCPVNHGLGGLTVCEDIPLRRSAESLNWDGMYNTQWFPLEMIDRKSGVACTMMTQVFPCPDHAVKQLWAQLERAVYASLRQQFGKERL